MTPRPQIASKAARRPAPTTGEVRAPASPAESDSTSESDSFSESELEAKTVEVPNNKQNEAKPISQPDGDLNADDQAASTN